MAAVAQILKFIFPHSTKKQIKMSSMRCTQIIVYNQIVYGKHVEYARQIQINTELYCQILRSVNPCLKGETAFAVNNIKQFIFEATYASTCVIVSIPEFQQITFQHIAFQHITFATTDVSTHGLFNKRLFQQTTFRGRPKSQIFNFDPTKKVVCCNKLLFAVVEISNVKSRSLKQVVC